MDRERDLQQWASAHCIFTMLPVGTAVPPAVMEGNMRAALKRNLPELRICKPHDHVLSIAAGGPSLADTYQDLKGYVVAMNGSLNWLLEHGVRPYACGLVDPGEHIADMVPADPSLRYFVASICDAKVFDKLTGCPVTVWHPSGHVECEDAIRGERPADWLTIGGGCTMGLRWITLGYMLGFRTFHLHGMDSSFRKGATHAYPDVRDDQPWMMSGSRFTRRNFLEQVADFLRMLETFERPEFDPIHIEVHGDGLLQDAWKYYRRAKPEAYLC